MFVSKLTLTEENRKSGSTPVVTAGSWQFRELPQGETVIRADHIQSQLPREGANTAAYQPYSKEEGSVRIFARDLFTCLSYMKVEGIKFS